MTLLDSEHGRKALAAADNAFYEMAGGPREALEAALPFLAEAFAEAVWERNEQLDKMAGVLAGPYGAAESNGWKGAYNFLRTLR